MATFGLFFNGRPSVVNLIGTCLVLLLIFELSLCTMCTSPAPICQKLCSCVPPTTVCNFPGATSIPKFTPISGYSKLLIQGNRRIKTLQEETFPVWGIKELRLSGTGITDIYCTALDTLKASLTVFYLTNNLFKKIPQCMISRLTALTNLYIVDNPITSLSIGDFRDHNNLKVLDLSRNRIEEIHLQTFDAMSNLKQLILHGNRLSSLKDRQFESLGTPILDLLDLSHNSITVVTKEIFEGIGSRLRALDLSFNHIAEATWPQVMAAFPFLPQILVFNVSGNPIGSVNTGAFDALVSLQTIEIAECALSDLPWDDFGSKLLKLNASDNKIINSNLEIFLSQGLASLSVSGNKIFRLNVTRDSQRYSKDLTIWSENCQLEMFNLFLNHTMPSDVSVPRPKVDIKLSGNRLKGPINVFVNDVTGVPGGHYLSSQSLSLDMSDNHVSNGLRVSIRVYITAPSAIIPSKNQTLDEIPTCDFHDRKIKLELLDLSGNNLQEIPQESCVIGQVGILRLNRNSISVIRRLAVNTTRDGYNLMTEIELRENGLTVIEEDAFEKLPSLKLIDLRQNALQGLPDLTYLHVLLGTGFQSLHLDDNPLVCDCSLLWAQNVSYFFVKRDRITGRCLAPTRFEGLQLPCITMDTEDCMNMKLTTSTTEKATLSNLCMSDCYVDVRDFELVAESISTIDISWRRIGPGVIYGYKISYNAVSGESTFFEVSPTTESIIHPDITNSTIYMVSSATTYVVCLTILLPPDIIQPIVGRSVCANITMEHRDSTQPTSPVVVGLAVALAAVLAMIVAAVAIYCIIMRRRKLTKHTDNAIDEPEEYEISRQPNELEDYQATNEKKGEDHYYKGPSSQGMGNNYVQTRPKLPTLELPRIPSDYDDADVGSGVAETGEETYHIPSK